jgi:hypothetical protein
MRRMTYDSRQSVPLRVRCTAPPIFVDQVKFVEPQPDTPSIVCGRLDAGCSQQRLIIAQWRLKLNKPLVPKYGIGTRAKRILRICYHRKPADRVLKTVQVMSCLHTARLPG